MKRNLLRPLTRPVRSPLHSSSVCVRSGWKPTPPVSGPLNLDQNRLFRSVRRHRSEIMFGVLVVVFCRDCVAALGFSFGERQIPFIVSSRVVRAVLFGAGGIR